MSLLAHTATQRRWRSACLALALLLLFLMPELVATGWFLINGDSVEYHDWMIRVPKGWFSITSGESRVLSTLPRFYLWKKPPSVTFAIVKWKQGAFSYDLWKTVEGSIMSEDEYVISREHGFTLLGYNAYCLDFAHARDASRGVAASCYVPDKQLSIGFRGEERYRNEFSEILQSIQEKPVAGRPRP